MFKKIIYFFLISMTFSIVSCGPDGPDDDDPCQIDFDKASIFAHVVDHTLVPGYQDLFISLNNLSLIKDQFLLLPTENNLQQLRDRYTSSYLTWQKMAQFEFGPAGEVFLRNSINNFPLNEQDLLDNIQTGNYDFSMPEKYDKGFPALDFMLYGFANSDQEIIDKYTTDTDFTKNRQYLDDVVADMLERVIQTREKWDGGYKDTFKNNIGTAAGSSLSLIINSFDENYELIKREKLGVPSGVLTLDIPNPDRVEAIHSGLSTELLKAGAQASVDFFNGVGYDGTTGPSLADLLDAANARKDNSSLTDLIVAQFDTMLSELDKLSESLDQEIADNKDQVTTVYAEFTRPLVNIKTDMPSVLCVSITYIDNPSDSD